jgi:hypothetical protein
MTNYQKIHKKTNKYLKRRIPNVLIDIINDYNRLYEIDDKALKVLKKKINANFRTIIGKGYRLLKINVKYTPSKYNDKEYYDIYVSASINHYTFPFFKVRLNSFTVNRYDLTLTMNGSDKIYPSNNLRFIFNDFNQEYHHLDNLKTIVRLRQQIDVIKSAEE